MSAQMLIPPLIFGLVQSADLDWCVSCARSDKNAQMHAPECSISATCKTLYKPQILNPKS